MAHKKTEQQDKEEVKKTCDCDENCTCGCNEGKECTCNHENKHCKCEDEHCKCEDEHCDCGCNHDQNIGLANEYLNMARIIQADFDNYRKRSAESIRQARIDGTISAVEVILPSLDIFKKAKQMIKDENAIKGIEMVESEIYNSLKTLGVEKIEALGKEFDPNLHYALAVIEDKTKPNNIILEEYQAGYRMGDKIIKYSQVIVNKLKEEN